jgi:hypothetical protein
MESGRDSLPHPGHRRKVVNDYTVEAREPIGDARSSCSRLLDEEAPARWARAVGAGAAAIDLKVEPGEDAVLVKHMRTFEEFDENIVFKNERVGRRTYGALRHRREVSVCLTPSAKRQHLPRCRKLGSDLWASGRLRG